MIAILTVVLLILVIYMAVKDRETNRKFMMIESSIDGLNQELFKLKTSKIPQANNLRDRVLFVILLIL